METKEPMRPDNEFDSGESRLNEQQERGHSKVIQRVQKTEVCGIRRQRTTVQKRQRHEKPDMNKAVDELQRQNPQLNQYMQGINDYIAQLEERLKIQETRMEDRSEKDDHEVSSPQIKILEEEEKETNENLERRNNELMKALKATEDSKEMIKKELTETEATLNQTIHMNVSLESRNNELMEALKSTEDSKEIREEELRETETNLDQAIQMNENSVRRNNDLMDTLKATELSKEIITKELRETETTLNHTLQTNANLERRNNELTETLEATEIAREMVTKELTETESSLDRTIRENTNLQMQVDQHMERENESHNTINRLKRDLGNLQTRLRDLELGNQRRHTTGPFIDRSGETGQTSSILERIGAAIRGNSDDSEGKEKNKKASSSFTLLASLLGISEEEDNTGQRDTINISTDKQLSRFFGQATGETKKTTEHESIESAGVETWPNILKKLGKMQQSVESLQLNSNDTVYRTEHVGLLEEYESTKAQEWSKKSVTHWSKNIVQSAAPWQLPWILQPKADEPFIGVETGIPLMKKEPDRSGENVTSQEMVPYDPSVAHSRETAETTRRPMTLRLRDGIQQRGSEQERLPRADEQRQQRENPIQNYELFSSENDEDLYS